MINWPPAEQGLVAARNDVEMGKGGVAMRSALVLVVVIVVGCVSAVNPSIKVPEAIDLTSELQTACDRGDASSCSGLGRHLSFWDDPHDEPRAVRAFMKGCDLGFGEACASSAIMFEAGRGAPVDFGEAQALHGRGCALGYSWSCADQRRLAENAELPGELTRDPQCGQPCDEGLDKDEILRVMRRRQGSVQYCYVLALARNKTLTADVATKFVINAGGGVEQSEATNATDPGLAACVIAVLRTFRFPRPRGGGVVNVTFPYLFRTPDSLDGGVLPSAGAR